MVGLEMLITAALAALALAFILSRRKSYKQHVQQLQPQKPKRQLVIGTWTREEVSKHKSADDLWLIIKDKNSGQLKVYDVTDYIEEHPGGMAIMYNAGGDATSGFHGPQHPPTVHELIKDYCIGTVKDP
eukprot:GHRR01018965.1.p2 GENE.GHRR01018965.1~~GHRR01018965.1.p2  ORF type:complete len:129 (+),score=32.42 GHRR01018965.1:273-659(+)